MRVQSLSLAEGTLFGRTMRQHMMIALFDLVSTTTFICSCAVLLVLLEQHLLTFQLLLIFEKGYFVLCTLLSAGYLLVLDSIWIRRGKQDFILALWFHQGFLLLVRSSLLVMFLLFLKHWLCFRSLGVSDCSIVVKSRLSTWSKSSIVVKVSLLKLFFFCHVCLLRVFFRRQSSTISRFLIQCS